MCFKSQRGKERTEFKAWHFSLADTKDALRTETGQPVMARRTIQLFQMDTERASFHLKTLCWKRPQWLPFHILAISKAFADKQWGSDLAKLDLEAKFNQISVVNILVQPYSWILAFVLCSSVVDQSHPVLSVNAGLSGLHLAVSGCWCFPFRTAVLGVHTGLVGSSNLRVKRRTASAPLFNGSTHTNTRIHLQLLPATQRNTFPLQAGQPQH